MHRLKMQFAINLQWKRSSQNKMKYSTNYFKWTQKSQRPGWLSVCESAYLIFNAIKLNFCTFSLSRTHSLSQSHFTPRVHWHFASKLENWKSNMEILAIEQELSFLARIRKCGKWCGRWGVRMQQAPSPGLAPTAGVHEISSRMTMSQRQVAETISLRLNVVVSVPRGNYERKCAGKCD